MSRSDEIRAFAADPYRSYPAGARYTDDVQPGGLLDIEPARQWMSRIDQCRDANLYSFGMPLDTAARPRAGFAGGELLLFSTYSYLGLNGHPRIVAAATEAAHRWGTTTGGVRLMTGTLELHLDTEQELAAHIGAASAALYSSGYDANIAAISALIGRHDIAIIDAKAHRSILDGCRLSGAKTIRFRHNDTGHLDELLAKHAVGGTRVLVAVDGVYSMDGDIAPLAELITVKDRHGAFLLLDESHAIGVLGPDGAGTCSHAAVDPATVDIITGSLGKAFPSGGGFVAGSRGLINYLQHGSAPYMFSSATTPASTAAIRETVRVIREEPEHLENMWKNTARLRGIIDDLDLDSGGSRTPIVPVILGETLRSYAWARHLLDDGIYTSAVPAPAVPEGQSRLRLCATAAHLPDDLSRLETALRRVVALES
ncbi:8-amino-7-oxononanoate synthase [Actinoplanes lutulentus]|uniref:8-amino-7-oxononanoate synthase n=1 Tax=Actinoplanes lutulentus TaxID=1287878 RepID=A0A327ZBY1_9ACTN|nr:pyridoxal phosphate-dependent aminotransferase family protein [Actinoplanes lutulentus]MBB2948324.1 8-amino-7-oxononanoate synthase [Actinoplanes lutulentus]RAK30356.1 glycine C-acetyltransferase/8-amino-7-oxononanoate synthase [Actinoplanes lutulentus]